MEGTMKPQQMISNCWLCFLICLVVSYSAAEEPEVVLSTGRVRGLKLVSAVNRSYYSFRGIPYAAPPTGYLRFKAPQPPSSWNGTLEAFDIPPACSQPWRKLQFPEKYSEDCLFINVFTPYLKPPGGVPMPVMVWVHGGKYFQGSSTSYKYGADFLVTGDVVLVTFNYRLGVFGYLNYNTASAQGNAADKDKVAALRWVQQEISQFGGDPSSVTIFGGSSGGSDVNCLYLSPLAKGLFHRAISQSGANCAATKHNSHRDNPAFNLTKLLGCSSPEREAAVACLRGITAQVLAERQMDVAVSKAGEKNSPFLLTVEKSLGEEVFMPLATEELLKKSQSSVPYMMGVNSGEGQMFVDLPEDNPTQLYDFENDFETYLPDNILQSGNNKTIAKIVDKLKKFYFNDKPISFSDVDRYMQFMMDSKFAYPTVRTAKILSRAAPVYLYFFSFEGAFETHHENDRLVLSGVNHGEELGYLFHRSAVVEEHRHMWDYPRECATVTRMVRLWTNFAKYGNPTPNKNDSLLNVTWYPVRDRKTQHLVINDTLEMIAQELLATRMSVWQTVYSWVQETSSFEAEYSIGITILLCVSGLACISLVYLLYTSTCTKGYRRL